MWTIDDLDEFALPDDPCDISLLPSLPECPECGEETGDHDRLCADCAETDEVDGCDEEAAAEELPF